MLTRKAGSFCLCCFWQAVRHLWSLQVSGIPHHMDLHPSRSVYLTSWFNLSVSFLTGGETSVVDTLVWDPPSHRSPTQWKCYPKRWFILSVLFLTGSETSVVATSVCDPTSHRPPPWQEHLPNQPVHSVCVFLDRWWDICGPYTCLESPFTQTSTLIGTSIRPASSFCLCCPYTCLGSPITWIYNLVGMSTGPAGSFSLCLFWQAVRCHTDLHPGRNIYLTSWFIVSVLISVSPHGCLWFILSVLFLIGSGMSVVPTLVPDPLSHRPLP